MKEECGEVLELPQEKSSQDVAAGAGVKGELPPREAEDVAAGVEVWLETGKDTERGSAEPERGPWRQQKGLWRSRAAV